MDAYVHAILSDITCGEACWCAKEDICKCSCGGKNHGILRTADGTRPVRTAKIDGYKYELLAVGERHNLYPEVDKLIKALPLKATDKISDELTYHYHWHDTDKGSPIRLKYATPIQVEHWDELTAFRGLGRNEFILKNISLIWKQVI